MNKVIPGNSKKVSLGGILLALTEIALFAAAAMPAGRLSAYVLSSFFVSVIVIEFGIGKALLFYAASSLLSLIIMPDKIRVIPYIVFFGAYGIVKFLIERTGRVLTEYLLKIVYYNMTLVILFFISKRIFIESISISGINQPLWLAAILLEVLFILYDYVYSLFIVYYREKIKKALKI